MKAYKIPTETIQWDPAVGLFGEKLHNRRDTSCVDEGAE
jgi:hypothetical protein